MTSVCLDRIEKIMKKAVYSVLVILPLVLLLAGVAGLLPDRVTNASVGGVPLPIMLILGLLTWSVILAWVYLQYEDRGEDC
jgi:hypothetical protein